MKYHDLVTNQVILHLKLDIYKDGISLAIKGFKKQTVAFHETELLYLDL